MNLDLGGLDSQMMHFNTVAEDKTDGVGADQPHIRARGRLMRLATWINLDSRLSVSYYSPPCWAISDHDRLVALEPSLVMSSADEPRTTSQTTRMCCLRSGSVRLKCSRSPTLCSLMPMLWRLYRLLGLKATQII